MASKWEENEDIREFQEYLRIPSVQPDVDYGEWFATSGVITSPIICVNLSPIIVCD